MRIVSHLVTALVHQVKPSCTLVLLAGVMLSACGDGPAEVETPVGSVTVTPTTVTFSAVGDTEQLSAAASDASGNSMPGVQFTWTSSDATVASVSTSGVVTSVGSGTATISATAQGVSGTASVTVVTHWDQTEIPAIEHQALVALYESANGANWTNKAGWLETNTPCSWYGVHCASGAVFGLNFDGNRLAGSIPSELGNLGNLAYLIFQGNSLSGTIPVELGNLDGLIVLELNDNYLSGPIPAELGELTNLEILNLHNNQLSGSIPVELGNLTNMRDLYLHENRLEGTIPEELGNMIDLRVMFLRHNQLTGLMPVEVAVVGGSISPDICQWVPGNAGLFMPDTPEYRAADIDGDGYICRLGFTP